MYYNNNNYTKYRTDNNDNKGKLVYEKFVFTLFKIPFQYILCTADNIFTFLYFI